MKQLIVPQVRWLQQAIPMIFRVQETTPKTASQRRIPPKLAWSLGRSLARCLSNEPLGIASPLLWMCNVANGWMVIVSVYGIGLTKSHGPKLGMEGCRRNQRLGGQFSELSRKRRAEGSVRVERNLKPAMGLGKLRELAGFFGIFPVRFLRFS